MQVWRRFNADNLGLYAAAISFYALLSVVPLLLVGTALLGFLVTPEGAQQMVLDFFGRFVPGKGAARALADRINVGEAVAGIVRTRGLAALIGFGSLFWSASQVFFHLQTAMNVAWRVRSPRHVLKARALSLAMVFAAGALFLLSLVFTAALQLARALSDAALARIGGAGFAPPVLLWQAAGGVATLVLSVLTFFILLRVLPATRVPWRAALVAAVGVGVAWELAKQGFAFYLGRFAGAQYNKVYGTLGGLVGLVLWVNLSALLLLIGAEMAAVWTQRHREAARDAGADTGAAA